MVSFRCTLNTECFMTEMYESLRSVYFPPNAIVKPSVLADDERNLGPALDRKRERKSSPERHLLSPFHPTLPLHLLQNGGEVVDVKHLFLCDVAAHGYLVFCCQVERLGN